MLSFTHCDGVGTRTFDVAINVSALVISRLTLSHFVDSQRDCHQRFVLLFDYDNKILTSVDDVKMPLSSHVKK